ncbi:MAG: hypothetical protein NTY19_21545 [Planctomycetota bacterium]|nr:hypothetical protein [Planctomycetota bacterium]
MNRCKLLFFGLLFTAPDAFLSVAEAWRWGSLWRRVHGVRTPLLTDWPLAEVRRSGRQLRQHADGGTEP